MKNKVLVVGGAGYIGAHIVDLLCDLGYSVIVYDNLSSGFKENLNKNAIFIHGDTLDEKKIETVFEKYDINSIVHLAAYKAADESMLALNKYSKNNIIGSLNVISCAIKYNVRNFIFSSTAAVYGNPTCNPIDENHPVIPINHYGFTKLYIEKYLRWISDLGKINYVALRYFNAAGYSKKKDLIKFKEKNPQNLLPIVMEVANNKRNKMKVFGNDYNTKDGTCIRDYIHVLDLASAHIKALHYLNNNCHSTIINLSTGNGNSVLDVIGVAEKITNNKINYNFSNRREGDPPILISTNNKAKKELGWSPKYSIEEIISSMWNIYNNEFSN
tara:strand:- start:218 stop:1204 length:987 start_codon:yes stop_codon:yes gene_type:complete